jgi:putative oxidoreductase
MMESLELNPKRPNAVAAGVAETAGGALLVAGLATPLASAALIGSMVTAIRKVHASSGLWNTEGGYEYNLVLIAALLALAEDKPGDMSVDNALGLEFTGFKWSVGALALGAAASGSAVWLGRQKHGQSGERRVTLTGPLVRRRQWRAFPTPGSRPALWR